MSDRKWLPVEYIDEICPPARDTPTAWIKRAAGDRWILFGDSLNEDDEDGRLSAAPGDIVQFQWYEDGETVDVQINGDGTFRVLGTVPSGNAFWVLFDHESTADSFDACVSQWIENDPDDDLTITIGSTTWSDPIPFRLVIDAAGARFEEVTTEPETDRLVTARADDAEAEVAKLRERVAALEAGLKPFADIAEAYRESEDDDFQVGHDFDTLGSSLPLRIFRAARALFKGAGQ